MQNALHTQPHIHTNWCSYHTDDILQSKQTHEKVHCLYWDKVMQNLAQGIQINSVNYCFKYIFNNIESTNTTSMEDVSTRVLEK